MPRSTTPCPEARLHAAKRRSMPRSAAAFDLVLNFGQCPLFKRLRSELHALRATAFQAARRRRGPHAQEPCPIRADPQRFGHPPHSLPGSGPVRADPPPGTGEHRTPRNLGECAPSHPRLCQASNHCENRYISRKTLTSAVVGHVCTFGSDDPRVFSDFNPLLRRPHLSTSMSASVSQLPNGKHSPLSHRNGTYYWQGE